MACVVTSTVMPGMIFKQDLEMSRQLLVYLDIVGRHRISARFHAMIVKIRVKLTPAGWLGRSSSAPLLLA